MQVLRSSDNVNHFVELVGIVPRNGRSYITSNVESGTVALLDEGYTKLVFLTLDS